MGWDTLLTGGVSLLNGFLGNKSAKAQQQGAQAGLDFTKSVYRDAQGNFQPYLTAGQGGLNGLSSLAGGDYSGFQNSPDYLYARDQAIYGGDHSAAAQGRLYSGGYPVDLAQQISGIASQNLGNYRNSLQYLAGMGQQSATSLGSIGNQNAQQQTNGYNNVANARASGYSNIGDTATSLGGLFNNWYQGRNTTSGIQPIPVAPPTLSYSPTSWG